MYNGARAWRWSEIVSSDICSDKTADTHIYDEPVAFERPALDDQPTETQLTDDVRAQTDDVITQPDIVYADVLHAEAPVLQPADEAAPVTYANLQDKNTYNGHNNGIYANAVPY